MARKVAGVIFAGGLGKRLLPLTANVPKPLLELKNGYTILDKQILDFNYADIKNIYILIGYLGEKIKKRYGGTKLKFLEEDKPQGTLRALTNALKHIKTDVVVRNGDVVSDINIKNFVNVAQKSDELITIAITKLQSPFGIIEVSDRKIISFKEKPVLDIFINAGIYYIKKEAFHYFNEKYDRGEIEFTVFPKLVEERKVRHYYENAFWRSVDGIKDLEVVRKEYENRNEKPWGYEKIIVNNEKYLVKELYIKKDFTTSVHYHPRKDESMHILEGEGYIEFPKEKKKIAVTAGNVIRIEPNKVHSIAATETLKIYEYSTPHPADTVRVKARYMRSIIE